jgi:hypothetical protein
MWPDSSPLGPSSGSDLYIKFSSFVKLPGAESVQGERVRGQRKSNPFEVRGASAPFGISLLI